MKNEPKAIDPKWYFIALKKDRETGACNSDFNEKYQIQALEDTIN